MNKEEVYDETIAPLMAQILATCKEHKIAMVASFSIPTEEDPGLRCSSATLEADCDPPKEFLAAKDLIYNGFTAFSVRTKAESDS